MPASNTSDQSSPKSSQSSPRSIRAFLTRRWTNSWDAPPSMSAGAFTDQLVRTPTGSSQASSEAPSSPLTTAHRHVKSGEDRADQAEEAKKESHAPTQATSPPSGCYWDPSLWRNVRHEDHWGDFEHETSPTLQSDASSKMSPRQKKWSEESRRRASSSASSPPPFNYRARSDSIASSCSVGSAETLYEHMVKIDRAKTPIPRTKTPSASSPTAKQRRMGSVLEQEV